MGLGKNTTAAVQSFRKRADDARRQLTALKNQKTDVDFGHYKNVLKNQEVINQAEKILREFKPVTYDVSAQLKAIDAFEAKAVEQAQASSDKIESELKDLKATLKNIEDARPFDQLSVDDVIAARPEIGQTVEAMVKAGKWTTPQYSEKFGSEFRISDLQSMSSILTFSSFFFPFYRLVRRLRLLMCSSAQHMGLHIDRTLYIGEKSNTLYLVQIAI